LIAFSTTILFLLDVLEIALVVHAFSTFNNSEIVRYISDPSNSNTLPIFDLLCVVVVVFKLQGHFIFSTLQIVLPIYKIESARHPGSI
jgi:hypothetical protein